LQEEVQAISVRLSPKRGAFMLAVNNIDHMPKFAQPYWVSKSNEVLIDKSDSQFKAKGRYRVAVTPYLLPEEE
jgi:hypothetical protein